MLFYQKKIKINVPLSMQTKFPDLTILYVEDDELIRKGAMRYLEKICKKVWGAKDGLEALHIYEDYRPDVIISDIDMPRLNGLDMAKKIRQHDKHTPIILATAFTQTDFLLKAVELQLIKYLVKPITSAKLSEALHLAYDSIHQEEQSIVSLSNNSTYDILNKVLIIDNTVVNLTKNEQLLLDILVKNKSKLVTYEEIEKYIWFDTIMSMDTLRSLVKFLRKKLQIIPIENISGRGYKLTVSFS